MMYYVRFRNGTRWGVKYAQSLNAALDCIAHARALGSVGGQDTHTLAQPGLPYDQWPSFVVAHVVQVNSDNTERQAYTEAY